MQSHNIIMCPLHNRPIIWIQQSKSCMAIDESGLSLNKDKVTVVRFIQKRTGSVEVRNPVGWDPQCLNATY